MCEREDFPSSPWHHLFFLFGNKDQEELGLRSSRIFLLKPPVQGLLLTHVGKGQNCKMMGMWPSWGWVEVFRSQRFPSPANGGDPRTVVSHGAWRGLAGERVWGVFPGRGGGRDPGSILGEGLLCLQ